MSWRIPITDLTAEYDLAGRAIEEAVLRVLRSGQYVLGPETRRFEAEMEELVGTRFVVGVGSGTEALVLQIVSDHGMAQDVACSRLAVMTKRICGSVIAAA